jgi:hypothetical protein
VTGATKWHPCLGPVKARSRRFLDIPGMTVFMCGGNRWCYLPANGGGPSKDLQTACRPSFNTLFTLQSYPVIDDNIWSSVVFLPLADKLRSTALLA